MMLLSIVGRFTTEDKFGKTLYQSIKGLIINSFGKKVWASLLYHLRTPVLFCCRLRIIVTAGDALNYQTLSTYVLVEKQGVLIIYLHIFSTR